MRGVIALPRTARSEFIAHGIDGNRKHEPCPRIGGFRGHFAHGMRWRDARAVGRCGACERAEAARKYSAMVIEHGRSADGAVAR
jgi:hypothetical protein